jgi:hypothetical protein
VFDAIGGRQAAHFLRHVPGFGSVIHLGKNVAVNVNQDTGLRDQSARRFKQIPGERPRGAAGFDDEGRQLSGFSALWASNLGAADYRDVTSGGVHIHQEVDVPVSAVSLRLGIADQMSNHLGTVELPLPVPAPADVPRTVRHSLPEIEPD